MDSGEDQRQSNLHGLHAGLQEAWNRPSIPDFSQEDESFEDLDEFTGSEHHHSLGNAQSDLRHGNNIDQDTSWHRRDSQSLTKRSSLTHLQHFPNPNTRAASTSPRSSPLSAGGSTTSWSTLEKRSSNHSISSFVDLTSDSSIMASSKRSKRRSDKTAEQGTENRGQPAKRRKVYPETKSIEEVDLRDVDSDSDLTKVLERQRAATIKDQQRGADQPSKLGKVTCVVCMEELTNMTATHCGK